MVMVGVGVRGVPLSGSLLERLESEVSRSGSVPVSVCCTAGVGNGVVVALHAGEHAREEGGEGDGDNRADVGDDDGDGDGDAVVVDVNGTSPTSGHPPTTISI
jgi:hypothetical protein